LENQGIKYKLQVIIYEADTPAGRAFDVALLFAIILSVVTVMLESVNSIQQHYGAELRVIEWIFTIIFGLEYMLRIWVVNKPFRYIFSFMGIIDLLSILPAFLGLVVSGTHSLLVIRSLRLMRVFRILKLARYVGAATQMKQAMMASRAKILVFLGFILSITVIAGTAMYLIEGGENGFTSIPRSIYWAIVTMTTVGYGDIAPHTVIGQTLASLIMLMGYAIIAVPTGIVSVELSKFKEISTQSCPHCSKEGHDKNANHCKYCGELL